MSQWEKVYGVHAVEALLRHHPKRVKQLWLAEGRHDPRVQVLTELAAGFRIPVGQRDRREPTSGRKASTRAWSRKSAPARSGAKTCSRNCSSGARACRCCWPWMASPIRTTSAPACVPPMRRGAGGDRAQGQVRDPQRHRAQGRLRRRRGDPAGGGDQPRAHPGKAPAARPVGGRHRWRGGQDPLPGSTSRGRPCW